MLKYGDRFCYSISPTRETERPGKFSLETLSEFGRCELQFRPVRHTNLYIPFLTLISAFLGSRAFSITET